MKTVLLCGGFGTRIRDVADDIPKPLKEGQTISDLFN